MALTFNMLLQDSDVEPRDVRLMRHQHVAKDGLTPFALWRDNRAEFERYQSAQPVERRSHFASRYWAAFVVPPDGSTLFVGLYEVGSTRPAPNDWIDPLLRRSALQIGRALELYHFERHPDFEHLIGRLKIDWGKGKRKWLQNAWSSTGQKPIVELAKAFKEPVFPGYTRFLETLASLLTLPGSWSTTLAAARGVYLLTCPRTKEQYVGSATGAEGFWGRWMSYVETGHGGNVALKSRDPSDYQVSILEVAGSADATEDILAMELLWKSKLQSRDMGLNRN